MATNFMDYMVSLAPEGETFLIVKQKPQGGTHADGTPKCTWPAFWPTARQREGESWYGNTASFILDRMGDRPSASAANCEYVLGMALDDIGTKSKTPPLPPTWIMETSPGNYQWWYTFSDQPTKGDFSAAIIAIAAAGYTDAGAVNPVRNFRLPGSVNIKPGRDNFVSRLVEFHPEREYTLPEICAALNVVPGEASEAFRPIKLGDDGNDDVLAWLSDQGVLLSKPNQENWAGVVCPNSAEHTDGNPEGRYNPAMRAYCCLHSHCTEFDSGMFLNWVADQGGPRHAPGLRDELLVSAMSDAMAKLTPTDAFPDEAANLVAETDRKERARLEKSEWWDRFAYVQDDEAYFDIQDRRELSRSTFNALFRHIGCKSIHNGRKIEPSISFDEQRQAKGAQVLVGITYAAGEDVLMRRDGDLYGNRWRNARPNSAPGDAAPWLRHVERMLPDEAERQHVLNVMAYKLQNPHKKINHAVLHIGHPGSGKDTMWQPFLWAIGGKALANVAIVRNEEITSQWGYALESEVMVFEELRQAEAKDRRALENHLKPIIAAPPEYLQVNRKGLHPYQALNRVFVLAFSNERVPLSLPSDDRRWFVVYSEAGRMSDTEGQTIWNWFETGGQSAVANWLSQRSVADFNPGAAPPFTEAKAIMIEHGRSTAESYLVDLIRNRAGEFARGVVASPFYSLCDRLAGGAPAGVKVPQAALMHALREAGWIDLGRIKSRANDARKHVFCAPDMAEKSRSELRDMAEENPAPLMVRVK
jgi:hypothetical protein